MSARVFRPLGGAVARQVFVPRLPRLIFEIERLQRQRAVEARFEDVFRGNRPLGRGQRARDIVRALLLLGAGEIRGGEVALIPRVLRRLGDRVFECLNRFVVIAKNQMRHAEPVKVRRAGFLKGLLADPASGGVERPVVHRRRAPPGTQRRTQRTVAKTAGEAGFDRSHLTNRVGKIRESRVGARPSARSPNGANLNGEQERRRSGRKGGDTPPGQPAREGQHCRGPFVVGHAEWLRRRVRAGLSSCLLCSRVLKLDDPGDQEPAVVAPCKVGVDARPLSRLEALVDPCRQELRIRTEWICGVRFPRRLRRSIHLHP